MKKVPSAESIARKADRGEDVSRFFTNRGRMMQPIQRVNVGFTAAISRNHHVVPQHGKWAVIREGADKAGSLHDTQSEAIEVGRDRAIRDGGELVIHDRHGRIRDKDSYGHDSHPPKDTKH